MKHIFIAFFFLLSLFGNSQIKDNVYVVEFTDKIDSPYSITSPEDYLSERAISRREKQNIAIKLNDLPVNPNYTQQLLDAGEIAIKYTSKWMNCAVIISSDTLALDTIPLLDFVKSVNKKSKSNRKIISDDKFESAQNKSANYNYDTQLYGKSFNQLADINAHYLHQLGYLGDGMLIGVFDAGYNNVDSMDAFKNLRENNHIIGGTDFVTGNNIRYNAHNHGTWVLSTMAAQLPNEYVGSAPNADYWLYITEEIWAESPLEEYNWLVAAEHADSVGIDIINSSLSYTTFNDTTKNHTIQELDGKTAIVTRAATIAASKGILVVTSAGNNGNNSWHKIGFPADADSILTIGAINTDSTYANFSSVGNTIDGRIKPDITAIGSGVYIVAATDDVITGRGTSFSGPLVAGAMACLWQYAYNSTNMELITAIQQSSHQYLTPDSLMGYGIPNFFKAMLSLSDLGQLNNILGDSISLYPNPVEDKLNISFFSSFEGEIEFRVMDITGKNLITSNQNSAFGINQFSLKTSDLAIGTYTITIIYNEKVITSKFIKQ